MFNVSVKGNVRCNGIAQAGRGGMVRRLNNTMPPNRALSDTKLKFSDRLKAYLSSARSEQAAQLDHDDPYQFSDSEIVNRDGKKCVDARSKTDFVRNNKVFIVNGSGGAVKSETSSREATHGKTMSRLQAQIARNKVTVKHNRNSPDPKGETTTVKDTKRSIIGKILFITLLLI